MTRLILQHLEIEVASPRKTTGPQSKGLLRPAACHRPIFDVLKHVGYVQRLDITGDAQGPNIRTVRYLVKLLRKLDIPVGTFRLIVPPKQCFGQHTYTEACMELFNHLAGQRRPEEGAIPCMCDGGLWDDIPAGELSTVLEQANGRLILFSSDSAPAGRQRHESPCPVFMTGNLVFGCIRLDARGMVQGCAANEQQERPLCPASRFLRYVKSTQHKPATPCKRSIRSPAKFRNRAEKACTDSAGTQTSDPSDRCSAKP